jgi:hypothetical protein
MKSHGWYSNMDAQGRSEFLNSRRLGFPFAVQARNSRSQRDYPALPRKLRLACPAKAGSARRCTYRSQLGYQRPSRHASVTGPFSTSWAASRLSRRDCQRSHPAPIPPVHVDPSTPTTRGIESHDNTGRKFYRHQPSVDKKCNYRAVSEPFYYRLYYGSAYRRALMRIGIVMGCGPALLVIVFLIDVVFLPSLLRK